MIIGIDASRSVSGGAIEYLKGIFKDDPNKTKKFIKIYIWAPSYTLRKLPNYSWLKKVSIDHLGNILLLKIFWQIFCLPRVCKNLGVKILFNTDAGSLCPFKPSVTLVQDILPFDDSIIKKYKWYQSSFYRIILLRFVSIRRLKQTNHIIFLSKYSKKVFNKFFQIKNYSIIPHGVDKSFYKIRFKNIKKNLNSINVLYISNALIYKNQWNVIEAISKIKNKYRINIKLKIVGGGKGLALRKMHLAKKNYDKHNEYITLAGFHSKKQLIKDYENSHIFVFASSCEAFGITLLEAMSTGIPIACSNKSALPEIIGNNTIYFDPENSDEIAKSIMKIIKNKKLRKKISKGSKIRSKFFDWKKFSRLTWETLYKTARLN